MSVQQKIAEDLQINLKALSLKNLYDCPFCGSRPYLLFSRLSGKTIDETQEVKNYYIRLRCENVDCGMETKEGFYCLLDLNYFYNLQVQRDTGRYPYYTELNKIFDRLKVIWNYRSDGRSDTTVVLNSLELPLEFKHE